MVKSYNAKDVTLTIDGAYITGFAESMITCEKNEDNFTSSVGAQGDVVVNEVNDPRGTIKFTLQATSPARRYLDALANSNRQVSIWVNNKALHEKAGGAYARIKKPASREYEAEVGDREYEAEVFDYTAK